MRCGSPRPLWGTFTGNSLLLAATMGFFLSGLSVATASDAEKIEFFEKKVRPIFAKHCEACHSADTKPAGGLRVDDRNGLIVGGNSGTAIMPGKPQESLLLQRVRKEAKKRMPAEGEPLDDEQIAVLEQWVRDGATWPSDQASVARDTAEYRALRESHWAWSALTTPAIPTVSRVDWPYDDVDRFLLARLEASQLAPTEDASRSSWLRRVSYDLTGLPPSVEEIAEFVADDSDDAFARVVDRLLKSPRFGEQWGRHWLDVARYAESTGPSRNIPYPHAWRYRDYVVDALNRDIPFNQFVREQIAGDLLPAEDEEERNRLSVATGFLALGVKDVNQRFPIRFQMDNVDEQIDVVTRSVLALTVSCARCHDHKFDPVPQYEYYALAGIFTSTEIYAGLRSQMGGSGLAYYVPKKLVQLTGESDSVDPAELARLTAEVAAAKQKWESVRGTPEGLKADAKGVPHQRNLRTAFEKLQTQLNSLSDPAARGLVAHGVRDAEKVGATTLRIRGEAEKMGPEVPRGFLTAVSVEGSPTIGDQGSGRLELAAWLTSDANPLTSRVFVNRVWGHLFGQGLVRTVDNFGVTGDKPSHPELLDHLAGSTVADGWSLKRLVRRLVLSRAYRLASTASADHLAVDPQNRLQWRHAPRRLDAEEIRDGMLVTSGELNLTAAVEAPVRKLRMVEIQDNGAEARGIHEQANSMTVRSVYLPQLRGLTPQSLEAFDPAERTLVSGSREVTTVPGQALFLLNSSFVRKQSLAWTQRLLAETMDDTQRIQRAFLRALSREPMSSEVERMQEFLDSYASAVQATKGAKQPTDERETAWVALTQALFASAEFRYVR
ncbi:MAG: PSD1 and planctomycete cytochrome C domain-containing protein [Pirellulales bacterium]